MTYKLPAQLPWDSIADGWEAAEEALTRLDERLRDSDLREAWLNRAHFQEACAALWLEGEIVSLEDLVLHDANTAPTLPSQKIFRARGVLLSRRSLARQKPVETLTLAGITALQERRDRLVEPELPEDLIRHDPEWDTAAGIEEWLEALARLGDLPALPCMALALKAWHEIEPFQNAGPTLGRLLVSALLWHLEKTKGMVLCLNLGLRHRSWVYKTSQSLSAWMNGVFDGVQEAATRGMEEHGRLVLARALMARHCEGHRRNSRLPALGLLVLEHPVVSLPMAAKRLGMSQQGVAGLFGELQKVGVRELTGRSRFRAYGIV